jgi:hypothetical protein
MLVRPSHHLAVRRCRLRAAPVREGCSLLDGSSRNIIAHDVSADVWHEADTSASALAAACWCVGHVTAITSQVWVSPEGGE